MTKLLATLLSFSLIGSPAAPQLSEPDTLFQIMGAQVGADWGLDRIDGYKDSTYNYQNDGDGVRIYVVDTGVDASHPDFSGRVLDGFDAFNQNLDQTDCQGHGTHVAGSIAGTKYGVAKKSLIIPVRVLNCSGQGNTSTLTAGIDWIVKSHPADQVGIVNMSLGGPKDDAVNSAVLRLINAGMVVVSAAGNSNVDACSFSPASAPGVISVGSTNQLDAKSPFSNWGDCVDIFAPGSKISSNVPGNYNAVSQKSGTSQAAAFVSGAVAMYISAGHVSTATAVPVVLDQLSEKSIVSDSKSKNNNLLSVLRAEQTIVDAPTTVIPINVSKVSVAISAPKNFTIKYNKLYWSRPTYSGSYSKVSYLVQQYVSDSWKTLEETKLLFFTLNPRTTSDTSLYRVIAKTPEGIGPASTEIRNVGATAANLIAPVPDVSNVQSSKLLVSQRGGAGSSVADVSWAKIDGPVKYDVETSALNSGLWSTVRSTLGTSVKVVLAVGIPYEVRVWSINSSGIRDLVGSSFYLGK